MKNKKKTKAVKKNSRGRPNNYKPEYCDLLLQHMAKGFSFKTFGAEVGVSRTTVDNWLINKDFLDAKSRAEVLYRKFWEEMGIDGASGKLKNFNASAWVFNMKNRFQWRNEILLREEKRVEAVTIELPSSNQAQTITLAQDEYKDKTND